MAEGRQTDIAGTLAELGRRVGQAMDQALLRIQPAVDALAEAARRPEVRALLERMERLAARRPCLCMCARTHPDDRGICETFGAVITRPYSSDLFGDFDVPMCAPCAAARAAHEFTGQRSRSRPGG